MKAKLLGAIFILIWIAFMPLSAQQPKEIPPKPTDETYEYIPFPTGEAIWSNRRYDNIWTPQEPKNTFSTIFMKGDAMVRL